MPPRHLLLTQQPGTEEETVIEAWLQEEGTQSRLIVEERGLGSGVLHFHAAGWQVHLEDLARSLRDRAGAHPDGWSAERPPRPGRPAGGTSSRLRIVPGRLRVRRVSVCGGPARGR
jgi:hypothetical protein